MKKLALLCSGGDSPGMNAAIRAIVRTALYHGIEVMGINKGYEGLIDGDLWSMKTTDVSNIIQRGGTILKSARSMRFKEKKYRDVAAMQLQKNNIDALVLIGGDGTFRGAQAFFEEYQFPSMGLPGTIDKDLAGTDFTIGFDTAVNTAMEAIDKIRDTADSHSLIFVVEVMGRDAGYIALNSGIACGAEDILIPELKTSIPKLINRITDEKRRKKNTHIIVVAEGDDFGGGLEVKNLLEKEFPDIGARLCILGHIQRGGSPTYADRVLASRLGYNAVMALMEGRRQEMVGIINGEIVYTPYSEVVKQKAIIAEDIIAITEVLTH